ncbi:MAG: GIY-YIG nuclease family protein [Candidatus Margulisbacteria bacterium]|nr:GIY-YIG nuclease family protein [Candidatus Margulisiibacteriota bacterium]
MYIVYVLSSLAAKKSYVGMTDDIDRRLNEHNAGKSSYTSRHMPWKLVYKEEYVSIMDARKREEYLKSTSGRRILKKIFGILEQS